MVGCSGSLLYVIICAVHLSLFLPLSARLQPSSTLSSYVSACAYSPTNQYGVYSGPAGSYVAPGHHHWQPQSPVLSHPGSGMSMHAGEIHSSMSFKHQAREGTSIIIIIIIIVVIILVVVTPCSTALLTRRHSCHALIFTKSNDRNEC